MLQSDFDKETKTVTLKMDVEEFAALAAAVTAESIIINLTASQIPPEKSDEHIRYLAKAFISLIYKMEEAGVS